MYEDDYLVFNQYTEASRRDAYSERFHQFTARSRAGKVGEAKREQLVIGRRRASSRDAECEEERARSPIHRRTSSDGHRRTEALAGGKDPRTRSRSGVLDGVTFTRRHATTGVRPGERLFLYDRRCMRRVESLLRRRSELRFMSSPSARAWERTGGRLLDSSSALKAACTSLATGGGQRSFAVCCRQFYETVQNSVPPSPVSGGERAAQHRS